MVNWRLRALIPSKTWVTAFNACLPIIYFALFWVYLYIRMYTWGSQAVVEEANGKWPSITCLHTLFPTFGECAQSTCRYSRTLYMKCSYVKSVGKLQQSLAFKAHLVNKREQVHMYLPFVNAYDWDDLFAWLLARLWKFHSAWIQHLHTGTVYLVCDYIH